MDNPTKPVLPIKPGGGGTLFAPRSPTSRSGRVRGIWPFCPNHTTWPSQTARSSASLARCPVPSSNEVDGGWRWVGGWCFDLKFESHGIKGIVTPWMLNIYLLYRSMSCNGLINGDHHHIAPSSCITSPHFWYWLTPGLNGRLSVVCCQRLTYDLQ